MTPSDYLNKVVLPTVVEFRDNPRDQRRAYLACLVTAHLADYIAAADKIKQGDVREAIRQHAAAHFDYINTICNAVKHSRPDRKAPFDFKPGDDVERQPLKWGEFEWGMPIYTAGFGGRDVEVKDKKYDIYVCIVVSLTAFSDEYPQHVSASDIAPIYDRPNIAIIHADLEDSEFNG